LKIKEVEVKENEERIERGLKSEYKNKQKKAKSKQLKIIFKKKKKNH
jgi:hypothetical protein